jgi:hypothetical protein
MYIMDPFYNYDKERLLQRGDKNVLTQYYATDKDKKVIMTIQKEVLKKRRKQFEIFESNMLKVLAAYPTMPKDPELRNYFVAFVNFYLFKLKHLNRIERFLDEPETMNLVDMRIEQNRLNKKQKQNLARNIEVARKLEREQSETSGNANLALALGRMEDKAFRSSKLAQKKKLDLKSKIATAQKILLNQEEAARKEEEAARKEEDRQVLIEFRKAAHIRRASAKTQKQLFAQKESPNNLAVNKKSGTKKKSFLPSFSSLFRRAPNNDSLEPLRGNNGKLLVNENVGNETEPEPLLRSVSHASKSSKSNKSKTYNKKTHITEL